MKKIILMIGCGLLIPLVMMAQIASDDASNYNGGNPWVNGSNGGSGFEPWTISPEGNAGAFIGDPGAAGISGLPNPSFGLFANPAGGNFVNTDRAFSNPMPDESTFSFLWGVNWDSDGSGNKGFNLYVGGTEGDEVININHGGSAEITINGNTMFTNFGTNAMLLHFEYQGSNTLRVYGTGRDGIEEYDEVFTISGSPDAFRFYASDLAAGDDRDNRQPYFNNFLLEESPLPVTFAQFTATQRTSEVLLNWSFQATHDFDRMIVEHSTDIGEWAEIYQDRSGEAGVLQRQSSSTVHRSPVHGHNYYRLRAIGRSGDERISPIRMVRIDRLSGIRLVNTSVDNTLIVERAEPGSRMPLLVTDGHGKVVQSFELGEGEGRQSFYIDHLAPGMYFLTIEDSNQKEVFKFVKH